jgi:hypothetical protein
VELLLPDAPCPGEGATQQHRDGLRLVEGLDEPLGPAAGGCMSEAGEKPDAVGAAAGEKPDAVGAAAGEGPDAAEAAEGGESRRCGSQRSGGGGGDWAARHGEGGGGGGDGGERSPRGRGGTSTYPASRRRRTLGSVRSSSR